MRLLLAAAAVLALSLGASAEEMSGRLGVGGVLGVPFGVTGKYWLDGRRAVQSHIGVSDGDLSVATDLLFHYDQVLPRKREGRLPLYLGLGAKYKAERKTFGGVRLVAGVAMFKGPVEIFAELAPVWRVAPSHGGAFDGAFGVRRYFR